MASRQEAVRLTFRRATLDDVPALVALVESAYRGESSRAGWTHEADLLGGDRTSAVDVAARVAGEATTMLLVEQDGALRGCCHLERHGSVCHFGMFAVVPTLQGGGIGRALLAEAERLAHAEWACREMEMRVIDGREELLAWYLRRGYARTGVYEPFPEGPQFALKRGQLRFEVLRKSLG